MDHYQEILSAIEYFVKADLPPETFVEEFRHKNYKLREFLKVFNAEFKGKERIDRAKQGDMLMNFTAVFIKNIDEFYVNVQDFKRSLQNKCIDMDHYQEISSAIEYFVKADLPPEKFSEEFRHKNYKLREFLKVYDAEFKIKGRIDWEKQGDMLLNFTAVFTKNVDEFYDKLQGFKQSLQNKCINCKSESEENVDKKQLNENSNFKSVISTPDTCRLFTDNDGQVVPSHYTDDMNVIFGDPNDGSIEPADNPTDDADVPLVDVLNNVDSDNESTY